MLTLGSCGGLAMIAAAVALKFDPKFAELSTAEYARTVAIGSAVMIPEWIAIGALTPEMYQISNWIVHQPIRLVCAGIDYLTRDTPQNPQSE